MTEEYKTLNLCIEACSAFKDAMIEAAESEGKEDFATACENANVNSAYDLLCIKEEILDFGKQSQFDKYCYSDQSTLIRAISLLNAINNVVSYFDHFERIKSECAKLDSDFSAGYEQYKQELKKNFFYESRKVFEKGESYVKPPFAKEPWPIAIPTVAGVVGGFIGGQVANTYLQNDFSQVLPVILPIALGGGIALVIALINSKERSEHNKKVAACNAANDKNHKNYADELISQSGFAMYDYVIENADKIDFVMGTLALTAEKILRQDKQFESIPWKYRFNCDVLWDLWYYFNDKRVDSMKEAINLYISERREAEFMNQITAHKIQEMENEAARAAERNALIAKLSDALVDLRRSNDEAEAKRRTDAEELKSMLSDAQRREEKLKNDLSDAKGTLNDIKKQLDF